MSVYAWAHETDDEGSGNEGSGNDGRYKTLIRDINCVIIILLLRQCLPMTCNLCPYSTQWTDSKGGEETSNKT